MDCWIVIIVNLIVGYLIATQNILVAVPLVSLGLTLGSILVLLKYLIKGGKKNV